LVVTAPQLKTLCRSAKTPTTARCDGNTNMCFTVAGDMFFQAGYLFLLPTPAQQKHVSRHARSAVLLH
jgi:hypothetical protein